MSAEIEVSVDDADVEAVLLFLESIKKVTAELVE